MLDVTVKFKIPKYRRFIAIYRKVRTFCNVIYCQAQVIQRFVVLLLNIDFYLFVNIKGIRLDGIEKSG